MYFPLLCRSTYSLLQAFPKTEEYPARLKQLGLPGCALVELGNLGGVPPFLEAMSGAGLKGIVGCEFQISDGADGHPPSLWVLCKGRAGWQNLVRAVSLSYDSAHNINNVPRISLRELADHAGDWLVFCGAPGSVVVGQFFTDPAAVAMTSAEQVKSVINPHWVEDAGRQLLALRELFGTQLMLDVHAADLPAYKVIADGVRYLAKKHGVTCVAAPEARYLEKGDASDCMLLSSIKYKQTLGRVRGEMEKSGSWLDLAHFQSKAFYLRAPAELADWYTPAEIEETLRVADECSPPEVTGKILTPKFPCPGGLSEEDYFTQLCRVGWVKKVEPVLRNLPTSLRLARRQEYADRMKMELEVLRGAGFCGYFLVILDVIRHVQDDLRKKVGPGRGSVGGSLAAYLSGITRVDPLEFGLIFERFINKGRLQPGRNAPPDIDTDFQMECRQPILDYLRQKYGPECVAQMGTFIKIKGRSALRAVLSRHGRCSEAEINEITRPVPDEARITDDLEEMRKEDEVPSIVLWTLLHREEEMRPWCRVDENGELRGDLAHDFAQAIRLEGRCRGMGKHASAVVVTPCPVAELVPMVFDKNSQQLITGYDMRAAEAAGLLKLDVLGLATLDKQDMYERLMRTGRF